MNRSGEKEGDIAICVCDRCRKTLIWEEFPSHKCSPVPTGDVISLEIDYYAIKKDRQGRSTIITKTMDGTIYILKENKDLPTTTSLQQPDRTTDDSTQSIDG